MLKIAIIGVMAVFLALPLKESKPEFSTLIIISGCMLILGCAVSKIAEIIRVITKINIWENSQYISVYYLRLSRLHILQSLEHHSAVIQGTVR